MTPEPKGCAMPGCCSAVDAIAALQRENAKLRTMLREFAWQERQTRSGHPLWSCLACGARCRAWEEKRHKPGCAIDAALTPSAAPVGDCRHGSGMPPSQCGLCDDEGWTPGCDETEFLPYSSEGRKLRDAITKSAAPGEGEYATKRMDEVTPAAQEDARG